MSILRNLHVLQANGLISATPSPFYVYRIENKYNGDFYIGKTSQKIDDRILQHLKDIKSVWLNESIRRQPVHTIFAADIKKVYEAMPGNKKKIDRFIVESFSVEVLAIVNTDELACAVESLCINKYIHLAYCLN